ncbi:MAG: hypothetical protein JW971_10920 [Synergistales bacterium]|nr:hypothetical protein [Synergistales bacterium]
MLVNKKLCITAGITMFFCLALIIPTVHGDDDTYIYFLMRSETRNEWRDELVQKVPQMDESEKWSLLWSQGTALERVSYALSLLQNDKGDYFYEDLSQVSGFIPGYAHGGDPGLPRQLVIIQASLASLSLLCEIKTPQSLGVAGDIVQGLWQNPEFQVVLDRVGEEKGSVLYGAFSTSRGIFSVFQGEFT